MSDAKNSNYTILVVDDEPDLCGIYAFGLQKRGFNVLTAHSGNSAKAVLESNKVDLVITDFQMPDGTGLDLVRSANELAAASNTAVIPVIMITGWVEPGVVDAMREGAAAVHSKPVSFKHILTDVDVVLDLKAGYEGNRRHQPRRRLTLNVEVCRDGEDEATKMETIDISLGGVKLVNQSQPLIVNENYILKIDSPDGRDGRTQFVARAICRWQRRVSENESTDHGFQIGFAFDDSTRERLVVDDILQML